jgi:hypothetical protein
MSDDPPGHQGADDFDVVLIHGPTEDGEGARVLRSRGEGIEAGEVRPMREGRPLSPRSEVVKLTPRKESPRLYDVHVEHVVTAPAEAAPARGGPAQVATHAYRESWERTFGPRRADRLN